MTVTLFTIAEGASYARFIPAWWDSVMAMSRKPDEIVIVINRLDYAKARGTVPPGCDIPVLFAELDEPFSTAYFNEGVRAATSDWVSYCGIDDRMLPDGYLDLHGADQVGADIIVAKIVLTDGRRWHGLWDSSQLLNVNTVPAHSPFKRQLWVEVGGYPNIRWSDWGFWLRAAKHGVNPYHALREIAIFDVGETHETMSGVSLDQETRSLADRELADFRESLLSA